MSNATIRMINANLDDDGFMDAIASYVNVIQMQMYSMAQAAEVAADNAVEEFESVLARMNIFDAVDVLGGYLKTDLSAYITPFADPAEYKQIGDLPVIEGDFSINLPARPVEPELQDVSEISLPEAPEFFADLPIINSFLEPELLQLAYPDAPDIEAIVLPDDINLEIPPVPDIQDFDIPDLMAVVLPEFADTFTSSVSMPEIQFYWSETEYQSALLTSLRQGLVDLVVGDAYGVTPLVEVELADRAKLRETYLFHETVESVCRMVSSRGFRIPQKSFEKHVQHALGDTLIKANSFQRYLDILVADLQQKNLEFSLRSSVQLEGRLMELHNDIQRRSLEVAKYSVDTLLNIFQAKVRLFEADVAVFQIKTDVFKTLIAAQLAKLEVFKTELEVQRARLQLNESKVRVYLGQLEGVKSLIDLFKARVEAANAIVEVNNARIDMYEARLRGFDAAVSAKVSEYAVFSAKVKAQVQKVDIFKAQADAYKSSVQAYESLVEAGALQSDFEFKQEIEFPLEVYKSRVEAFRATVEAEVARINAGTEKFKAEVDLYSAALSVSADRNDANVRTAELGYKASIESAQAQAQAASNAASRVMTAANIKESKIRAKGQFKGQVAAAEASRETNSQNFSENVSESQNESVSKNNSVAHVTDNSITSTFAKKDISQTIIRQKA